MSFSTAQGVGSHSPAPSLPSGSLTSHCRSRNEGGREKDGAESLHRPLWLGLLRPGEPSAQVAGPDVCLEQPGRKWPL